MPYSNNREVHTQPTEVLDFLTSTNHTATSYKCSAIKSYQTQLQANTLRGQPAISVYADSLTIFFWSKMQIGLWTLWHSNDRMELPTHHALPWSTVLDSTVPYLMAQPPTLFSHSHGWKAFFRKCLWGGYLECQISAVIWAFSCLSPQLLSQSPSSHEGPTLFF